MNLINSVCSVIGMRSYAFPAGMHDSDIKKLVHKLDIELREAASEGKIIFQCGMSMGADIWAAKAVLSLRREMPQIQLHCYLPCETQANQWAEQWREPYFQILGEADEVFCMQTHFTKGCFFRRNREMLYRSSRVILLYGTKADGGITQAIDFCQSNNVETRIIRPSDAGSSARSSDEPIIQFDDYISSQTSSAYLAGLDIGMSAMRSAWL